MAHKFTTWPKHTLFIRVQRHLCVSCKRKILTIEYLYSELYVTHLVISSRLGYGREMIFPGGTELISCVPVMQESPRVGVRWSIISLNGISYKDAGEYRCQARNMAGISEAPIRLKVVGITRVSKLPRRKSQKTTSKSSLKNGRQNQSSSPSAKQNQTPQNTRTPFLNKTQTVSILAPRPSPKDSWRKTALRLFDVNRKISPSTSIKPPGPSSTGPV